MNIREYDWLDASELRQDDVFDSGWSYLVENLFAEINGLVEGTPTRLRALQIKEKFGSLRFYYRLESANDAIAARIASAVEEAKCTSAVTCFRCGQLASMRKISGWIVPLCEEDEAVVERRMSLRCGLRRAS